MSEAKVLRKDGRTLTWIDVLNEYGQAGWEVVFKLTDQSYLLKRVFVSE